VGPRFVHIVANFGSLSCASAFGPVLSKRTGRYGEAFGEALGSGEAGVLNEIPVIEWYSAMSVAVCSYEKEEEEVLVMVRWLLKEVGVDEEGTLFAAALARRRENLKWSGYCYERRKRLRLLPP